jgi:hypothetical protein
VIEPLEHRVLMSSIAVTVQTAGDGAYAAPTQETVGSYSAQTFRDAIVFANNETLGPVTISFSGSLAGQTITLGAALALTNTTEAITIAGLGTNVITISGNHASRVFQVGSLEYRGVTATINGDLAITAGYAGSGDGGGILNYGVLSVTACAVTQCTAADGGGIFNDGGTVTLSQCTISGDGTNGSSGSGGGIYSSGALAITGGTISGCTANKGGGIYNSGPLNITSSAIQLDTATGSGGGIYSGSGVVLLGNDIIGNPNTNSNGTLNGV